MTLWAIVPLKIVTSSKQRLANVLTNKQRIQLTLAMAEDVLTILQSCQNIDHIVLVSGDAVAAKLCMKTNAQWLKPSNQEGLNSDLAFACHYAEQQGASSCLILHADLPLLNSKRVDELIEQAQKKALQHKNMLAVVPCKEGSGSNLVYAPLPFPVKFVYGKNSFPQFKQLAMAADIPFHTLAMEDGDLDIDIPADLKSLEQRINRLDSSGAKTTRRALAEITAKTVS